MLHTKTYLQELSQRGPLNMLKLISNSLKYPVACQPFKQVLVALAMVMVLFQANGKWKLDSQYSVCHTYGESTWDYYEGKRRIVQVKYK